MSDTVRQQIEGPSSVRLSRAQRSIYVDAVVRLLRNPSAVVGAAILAVIVLVALLAPLIAPYDPLSTDPVSRMQSPSGSNLFGTDTVGRDVFSRVVWGSRISLQVGLIAVGIGMVFGILTGLVAGYYQRWVDTVLMRFMDVLLAFPGILLAMVLVAALGVGMVNVIIAVGIAAIPNFSRVVRGSVLSIKNELFVEAARVNGASDGRIMRVHILPNVLAPIIVMATLRTAIAILSAAALSFLGLGAQPPTPEWGTMLSEARGYLHIAWWWGTFPGLAIMATVLGLNLVGDGLRDALDPRLRSR